MMELAKIFKKFIHTLNYLKKNMNTIMREIEGIENQMELLAIKQYNILYE